jgi:hypothetical protein
MVWNTNFVDVYSANLAWLSVEKCVFFVRSLLSFASRYVLLFRVRVRGRSGSGCRRGCVPRARSEAKARGKRSEAQVEAVRVSARVWSMGTSTAHDQLGAAQREGRAGGPLRFFLGGSRRCRVRHVEGLWQSQTFIRVCAKQGRGVPGSWTTRLAGPR